MERAIDLFLTYLKTERGYSEHTLINYSADLSQFTQFIAPVLEKPVEAVRPGQITHLVIRQYLGHLQKLGRSRATVARKLAVLRTFYKFLLRQGLVERNPLERVSTPRQEKRLPGFLSEKEASRLVESPDPASLLGLRDLAILEVIYGCGLRVSELVGLNLIHLDLPGGYLRVQGKGGKERIVPMGRQAAEALEVYLTKGRPGLRRRQKAALKESVNDRSQLLWEQPLFLNKHGTRLSDRGVRDLVKKYASRSGLDQAVYPHLLRHTFATHLLDRGADLRSVQELLGHARLSTTQIYTHVTKKQLHRVYRRSHPRER
jgi:integrase/recombinase XerC